MNSSGFSRILSCTAPAGLSITKSARNTARVRVVVDALAEFLEARADFFAGRAPVG